MKLFRALIAHQNMLFQSRRFFRGEPVEEILVQHVVVHMTVDFDGKMSSQGRPHFAEQIAILPAALLRQGNILRQNNRPALLTIQRVRQQQFRHLGFRTGEIQISHFDANGKVQLCFFGLNKERGQRQLLVFTSNH